MKRKLLSNRGFSALELTIVICMIALLVIVILPAMVRTPHKPTAGVQCVNNLKQIGTAYRIWSADNGDRYPMQTLRSATNDGWGDFAKTTNAGQYCWSNYCTIPNELGQSPKILVCPSDERTAAKDFQHLGNKNLSYFVGAGANENYPLSILSGDRNLAPGAMAKKNFGYSPKDGSGNDIIVQTNTPVCWSLKMHLAGNDIGAGNILMGDGSVQLCSSASFRSDYQAYALDSGNFPAGYVNQSNSFRLIFP